MFKFKILFYFSCCLTLGACESPQIVKQEFDISSLNTVEKRKLFLDSILHIDQKVRTDAMNAQETYGYNSKEYIDINDSVLQVDLSNLKVIHDYLKSYDYPTEEEYGYEAYTAPWMVIHHAPEGYGIDYRDLNMQFLLKAWEQGKLKDKAFSFFLNRMYNKRFGESFIFEGSMKTSTEIDTLLTLMNYK